MRNFVIVNSGFQDAICSYGVNTVEALQKTGFIKDLLRKILVRVNQKNFRLFYSKIWLEELAPYDIIILYDCNDMVYIAQKIAERYPDKRLIFFYWNIIKNEMAFHQIPQQYDIWTYDYSDAVKYGLKYNGQFIYDKYYDNIEINDKYDVYFIGIDKKRFYPLTLLRRKMEQQYGLRVFFRFVDPVKALYSKVYSKRLPYSQVVKETAASKIILEYNQQGQHGLTMRCIESLVLGKKLITNNKEVKNYIFYDPNNIYILQDSNFNGFEDFLKAPFHPYKSDIVAQYTFPKWLNRILNDKVLKDQHSEV